MSLESRKKPPLANQKSARQSIASSYSKTAEVSHIVRVTVLGLTGLAVNKNWCADAETNDENLKPTTDLNASNCDVETSQNSQKIKPLKKTKTKTKPDDVTKSITPKVPNPDKLRAFVSLSRSSTIVGNSNLSHPLHRLYEHDVVGTNTEVSDGFEVPNMLDVERYAAVWPSTDNACVEDGEDESFSTEEANQKMGKEEKITHEKKSFPSNVISFETKLCRRCDSKTSSDNIKSMHAAKTPCEYAPKSFEVIVSLAISSNYNTGGEDVSHKREMESSFGIPLGVATLALNTQQQELELPVLNLSQARPTIVVGKESLLCMEQNKERDFGMKENIIQTNPAINNEERKNKKENKKQKRRIRWNLFGSKKLNSTKPLIYQKAPESRCHFLSDDEISAFNMKYSIGSSCKAVLRLKVEIFEKALDREDSSKVLRYHRKESSRKGKLTSVDKKHSKAFYELNRSLTPDIALIDVSDSEGDISDYSSDSSESYAEMSVDTRASWDTISTISTQGTRGTTYTTSSWNSGSTGSTRGAISGITSFGSKNDPNGEDENDTTSSLRLEQNGCYEDGDADEDESVDDSHVTFNFRGEKIRVSTPNPIHVACQGVDNTQWFAEKSTAIRKICDDKVWKYKYDSKLEEKGNSAESPHGVNEFDGKSMLSHSSSNKIPKALTFSERRESLKQTVIDAISCHGPSSCQEKYHTEPIELVILSSRSMVSLHCDDEREQRKEDILKKQQGQEGAQERSCKIGKLSAQKECKTS